MAYTDIKKSIPTGMIFSPQIAAALLLMCRVLRVIIDTITTSHIYVGLDAQSPLFDLSSSRRQPYPTQACRWALSKYDALDQETQN